MLSENDTERVVDEPHYDVSEAILCLRVCRLLFAEINKHTLYLPQLHEMFDKFDLWLLQRWFIIHVNAIPVGLYDYFMSHFDD